VKKAWLISLFMFSLFLCPNANAEEIQLSNGDKVTGEIIKETDQQVEVLTVAMGTVVIDKAFIKKPEPAKGEKEKSPWTREVSLGYSQTGGNTEESQGNFTLAMDRKTDEDEWNVKMDSLYSSSNKKMDSRKFYGMGRYAFSFGEKSKWYNFYKIEGDQDRFANIYYRIIPAVGIGYWFSDKEEFKVMVELAVGLEHTNYRDDTRNSTEAVLIPRGYLMKKLSDTLTVSEDVTLYPSLGEVGDFRLKSETALTNAMTESMALKVSFIDEFNSSPAGSTKKNDYRLVSSIVYAF